MTEIVEEEMGEPHIEGKRISVRQIAERVFEHAQDPLDITDGLGISVADVHTALAHYYNNIDEMEEVMEPHREKKEQIKEESLVP